MSDTDFIYALRNLQSTRKGLPDAPPSREHQSLWLEDHLERRDEYYFLITQPGGKRWGTIRIYDVQVASFTWGSWALAPSAPAFVGLEANLLLYHFALRMGLEDARFEVLRENESVWQFHENLGAIFLTEQGPFRLYKHTAVTMKSLLDRFDKFFPQEIRIGIPKSRLPPTYSRDGE